MLNATVGINGLRPPPLTVSPQTSREYFAAMGLIWNQPEFCLVSNQLENGKYNHISVWFNKIQKISLCGATRKNVFEYSVFFLLQIAVRTILHSANWFFYSFQIEINIILVTVFFLTMNQTELLFDYEPNRIAFESMRPRWRSPVPITKNTA